MDCPVCRADLTPLDIQSRNEHITLCLENGPSIVDFEAGRPVIKKTTASEKHRKICPLCSKTFQQIHTHFKKCAIKNDLTPDLMQDHWFKLNDQCNIDKCFPSDLLESYIEKCTAEGRVGEQVEFAKLLLSTLPEDGRKKKKITSNTSVIQHDTPTSDSVVVSEDSNSGLPPAAPHGSLQSGPNASHVLMTNARKSSTKETKKQSNRIQTALEMADKATKKANIALRIERELSATSAKRYLQAIEESAADKEPLPAESGSAILKYTLIN